MEKPMDLLLREYVSINTSLKELKKREEALKEKVRNFLEGLPNASGGKKSVRVGDYKLFLQPSKPQRSLNDSGLVIYLTKTKANLLPIITETKTIINEDALEKVILTGEITKEEIKPFILEKFREPSLMCEKAKEGEDSLNIDNDNLPEISEEMPDIIQEVLGDLD